MAEKLHPFHITQAENLCLINVWFIEKRFEKRTVIKEPDLWMILFNLMTAKRRK